MDLFALRIQGQLADWQEGAPDEGTQQVESLGVGEGGSRGRGGQGARGSQGGARGGQGGSGARRGRGGKGGRRGRGGRGDIGGRWKSGGKSERDDDNTEGGTESNEAEASTAASELEREDRKEEKRETEKRRKRKRHIKEDGIDAKVPHNLLELLSPLFTLYRISHNAAVALVAAFYRECNIEVDGDVSLSTTSSKRLRFRENTFVMEKALTDLSNLVHERNIPLTMFYDTKYLAQRMQKTNPFTENQTLERGHKDRLALVVHGPSLDRPYLLGMPGLDGGTALEQAEAAYSVLQALNLQGHIRDLSYDTTAVNTGRHGGTVKLLQLLMDGRACLCSPCRRWVETNYEIILFRDDSLNPYILIT